MTWRVRVLAPDEWALMKTLRIDAVRGAPDAFRPTLDEVLGEPDAYWQQMTGSLTHPDNDLLIATHPRTGDCGTTYVRIEESVGHIGAMWVAPCVRRQGVGQLLFETAVDWHRSCGLHAVELSVTEGNVGAQRLYERNGFTLTGATGILREGSPLRTLVMHRDL